VRRADALRAAAVAFALAALLLVCSLSGCAVPRLLWNPYGVVDVVTVVFWAGCFWIGWNARHWWRGRRRR
jgi:hypothetical protein